MRTSAALQLASQPELPDRAVLPLSRVPPLSATPGAAHHSQTLFDLQQELSSRHFVYVYPALAKLVGIKASLMLGHALYWTNLLARNQPQRQGWFWMTAQEWRNAVALTPREQESARKLLRSQDVWSEELVGRHGGNGVGLHFRIKLDVLAARLGTHQHAQSCGNPSQLLALLASPIVYYRPLADIAGGAVEGLVLCALVAAQADAANRGQLGHGGSFTFSVGDLQRTLGLGDKPSRRCRESLERSGLLSAGSVLRTQMVVRLNLSAILACLQGQQPRHLCAQFAPNELGGPAPKPTTSSPLAAVPPSATSVSLAPAPSPRLAKLVLSALGVPGGQIAGFRQSEASTLSKWPKQVPHAQRQFVEMGGANLSKCYGAKNEFLRNTTPPPPPPTPPIDATWRRGGVSIGSKPRPNIGKEAALPACHRSAQAAPEAQQQPAPAKEQAPSPLLTPPEALPPQLHPHALAIVAVAPAHLQQSVLDELQGTLSLPRYRLDNPLAWLAAVAKKASDGGLVLTVAHEVAAARVAAQQRAQRVAQHKQEVHSAAVPVAPSSPSPELMSQLQALSERLRGATK